MRRVVEDIGTILWLTGIFVVVVVVVDLVDVVVLEVVARTTSLCWSVSSLDAGIVFSVVNDCTEPVGTGGVLRACSTKLRIISTPLLKSGPTVVVVVNDVMYCRPDFGLVAVIGVRFAATTSLLVSSSSSSKPSDASEFDEAFFASLSSDAFGGVAVVFSPETISFEDGYRKNGQN